MRKFFITLFVGFVFVPSLAVANLPTTIEFYGQLVDENGFVQGRHTLNTEILYGPASNPISTGFKESHIGLEFLDGNFSITVGKNGKLTPEHLANPNARIAVWTLDKSEADYYAFSSFPYSFISHKAVVADSANSVDWDNITKPTLLNVVVSTANYASRALNADSALTAQSIDWSNIQNIPQIPMSVSDIQELGISSLTNGDVLSLVQGESLDLSKNTDSQHNIYISNQSYNNQTGAALVVRADEGRVVTTVKSTKDLLGRGNAIIGSESNHSVVIQQNAQPAITIDSSSIMFNRPIQLDWNSNQNLPETNAITFKKDVGASDAVVAVKNMSINNSTSAMMSVLGSNGDISGYLKAAKSNLGVGSVRIGSNSESNVFIDYNNAPAIEVRSDSIILHKQVSLAPGLGSTLNIAVESANTALSANSANRSTVADSANSVDWENVQNKPAQQSSVSHATSADSATIASNLNFSSPLILNSNTPSLEKSNSTGIVSMRLENTASNTNSGSEFKIIADSGNIRGKVGAMKNDSGTNIVYIGSESNSNISFIRNDSNVMTISNTNITSIIPVVAPSFSGSGASLTNIPISAIATQIPYSKLDISKSDITSLGIPAFDTNLTESQVVAYVENNGYINSESQVDAMVANNGYLTSYTDTNTQLTESQVDNYVANNGYQTSSQVQSSIASAVGTLGTLRSIVLEIGPWNMGTVASKSVIHSLSIDSIRNVKVMIRDDSMSKLTNLEIGLQDTRGWTITTGHSGSFEVNVSTITLSRIASDGQGYYYANQSNYDSTSHNRGWITIWYQE